MYADARGTCSDLERAAEAELARRAGHGDPEALTALEVGYFDLLDPSLRRARVPGLEPEDLRQLLRERLLVGPAPKILEYSGRGSLRGFLSTVAARMIIDLKRRRPPEAPARDEAPWRDLPAPSVDLEVETLRRRSATALRAALASAAASLTERERAVLRYQLLEGLSLEEIAARYGVHRATVARWLAGARDSLFRRTRLGLEEAMSAEGASLAALVALVQSQVELSLPRLLSDSVRR